MIKKMKLSLNNIHQHWDQRKIQLAPDTTQKSLINPQD